MNVDNICIGCMREKPDHQSVCPYCGFDAANYMIRSHHLEPYTILNAKYLLGRVLGEGGFGITYVALDLEKNQRVAIKELFVAGLLKRENTRTVLLDSSMNGRAFYNECKAKFIQEATLLQALGDKKGVVDIYQFFEENSTAYIVMEFLEGQDLLLFLKSRGGKIPFEEAFFLLRPVMKSLMEMHAVGVYHRDISPDNVRYLRNHQVKIMDLGGAKYLHREGPGLEKVVSHLVMVKHGYAPPEQYVTGYKIGPWMDVYAMGATFYRCITGSAPPESTVRVANDELILPSKMGVSIKPEVEKVLMKALALTPEERYTDMREFYIALKAAAGDLARTIPVTPPISNGTGLGNSSHSVMIQKQPGYDELLKDIKNDGGGKEQIPMIIGIGLIVVLAFVWFVTNYV